MKTFKVTATYSNFCTVEIEAESEDKAYEIAQELDGGLFTPCEAVEDWRIYDIQEVQ